MGEHWYTSEGAPCYEVTAKNGNSRATTLADARKMGLVPSVTTVLSVLAKPALETWKVRQGILAALTLAREPGEADDTYLSRLLTDSGQQARAAAEEGTRIHDAIEQAYKGRVVPRQYRPHVDAAMESVEAMFPGVDDWTPEASFCHPDGFGGKVDLHSPSHGYVVDFKGKDGDFTDGKRLAYDQHWQLAAYQHGLRLPRIACGNVFVSRTHPGKASGHKWSEPDIDKGLGVFLAALSVWKRLRNYDPSIQEQAA